MPDEVERTQTVAAASPATLTMDALSRYRSELDRIDGEILRCLAERLTIIGKVGEFKKTNLVPVLQPQRMRQVLEDRARRGRELGIEPRFVEEVWDVLIREACRIEGVVAARSPSDTMPNSPLDHHA